MKHYYTVAELMEKLGHSEKTILKLINNGEITAFKSAGKWRILIDEFAAYVQRNTHKPKGD